MIFVRNKGGQMNLPQQMNVEATPTRAVRAVPRWAWWATAGLIAAAGLALGWEWLSAIGVASVLVSFLPCALMCAFGLCMNRGGRSGGASCHGGDNASRNGKSDAAGLRQEP